MRSFSVVLGSIVCNSAIIYKRQNFFQVVLHVIIIEQCNQTVRLYEIQVTVTYSRNGLVAVTSECSVKNVMCKIWTGTLVNSSEHDQTPQNAAPDEGLHCILKLLEVNNQMK